MTGRCRDCAHWVTHRCRDRNRGPDENLFEPVSVETFGGIQSGECDRVRMGDALMDSVCMSEGICADLFTAATFGCIEFRTAPAGWDHYRFHRRQDDPDGRPNWVVDDMAHVEGRF